MTTRSVLAPIKVICAEYSCMRMWVSQHQTLVNPHASASFAFSTCAPIGGSVGRLIPNSIRPSGGGFECASPVLRLPAHAIASSARQVKWRQGGDPVQARGGGVRLAA